MSENKVGTAKRGYIILLTILLMVILIIPPFSQTTAYKNEIISSKSLAGWSEEVVLTTGEYPYVMHPKISAQNNYVHVVWDDKRSGNREIYYRRSAQYGSAWEDEKRLIFADQWSYNPTLTVSGSNVYVVWQDLRGGLYDEIYFKKSADNGDTWTEDIPLTSNDGYTSQWPDIAVDGNKLHLVWGDYRDGNYEIYYKNSTDGGSTWSNDKRLTIWSNTDEAPHIVANGDTIHVVWDRYLPSTGVIEVFYRKSTDGGITWQSEQQLTESDYYHSWPQDLVANGSNLYMVCGDDKDSGIREVYFMKSMDNGNNWGTPIRLSNADGYSSDQASIAVDGENLYVAWKDEKDIYPYAGADEIYYINSSDGGNTWASPLRLTYAPNESLQPSITVNNNNVHVVWIDNRTGDRYEYRTYYKRSPDFASNISLTANPSNLPADGTSMSILTATVTNKIGSPIKGLNVSFRIESGSGILLSNYNYTNSNGETSVIYRAGTISGDVVIDASVDGVWNTTTITLTSEGPADISLTASPSVLTADGTSTSLITATVTNETGEPVEGVTVNFLIESGCGGLSANSNITDVNGDAVTIYTAGTTTGDVVIKATANSISNTTTITLHPGSIAWINIEPPGPINLNTTESQMFTATGYDTFGNINNSWTPYWSTDHGLGTITPNSFTCTYTAGNNAGTDYINITDPITGVYNVSQINIIIKDDKPPMVIDKTPTGTDVSVNTNITATFNESMNKTSVENAFIVSSVVGGDFTWSDNTLIFTPTNPLLYNTTYNVTVTTDAKDAAGNHLENNYSWEFKTEKKEVNHEPVIEYYHPLFNPVINETENITFNITATDIDNDNLTYSWYINNTLLTWEINDSYIFISNYSSYGVYEIKVVVTDDGSPQLTDNHTWMLTVLNKNRPPALESIEHQTAYEEQLFTLQVNASDPDNDALALSDNTTLFDINITTGLISFTPSPDSAGIYLINISVTDGTEIDYKTFKLTINNVNRKPIATISSPQDNAKFTTKDNIFFDATGSSDPDNDNLIFTWNSDVDGNIGNTASFSKKLSKGTHTITLTVDDGNDGTDTKQITMTVKKPSEPSGGFIPGFETVTLLTGIGLLVMVILLLRKRKT